MTQPTYKSEQAKDGTWTIYNVPIFSVHVDKRGEDNIAFDASWLKKALKAAKTREAEGYYPPLHVRHHGDGDVEPAGKFRIKEIRMHKHGGKSVPTLFADLVGVRPEIYKRIRRGELSYRSVEILDIDSPELDSLALLDDEVPFFRYPLLKIGSERGNKQKTPALAYKAMGSRAAVLFNFEGQSMTRKYEDDLDMPEAGDEGAPAWAAEMLSALERIASAVGASSEDQEVEQFEEDEPEELKGVDIDIESEEEEEEPVELDDEEEEMKRRRRRKSAPGRSDSPVEVGMEQRAAFSAVTDEVRGLRAELNRMKAEKRIDTEASRLRASGVDEDKIKSFLRTFKQDGERAALVYSKAIRDLRPAEPYRHFSGEIRYTEDPDPKAVAVYASKGPEALEKARSLHRSYKSTQPDMPLERYIEINMDPDAFFAKARANAGKVS